MNPNEVNTIDQISYLQNLGNMTQPFVAPNQARPIFTNQTTRSKANSNIKGKIQLK